LVPGWFVGLFSKQKARVGLLKGLLKPLILDCLVETEDGRVVQKEWEGEEKPLLPDFVAYVLPKYSQEGKTVAQIKEMIVEQTAGRILGIWFAAIDTTSMTFSQVTMDLLGQSQAEYANVLREEIRTVLKKHEGQWSFEAVSELKHLDSFIHETLRLHPVGSHLAQRKVLLPGGITFSNGEHLPQGSLIELPIWFIHTDEQFYDSAAEFRGFRFVGEKHPEAAPSDTFMAFGHGNHACPGRRLALMVVKFMVIEMLMNYEYVPFEDGRPKDMLFGAAILPSLEQKIRIRKRVV
jgi:cytochrome P450